MTRLALLLSLAAALAGCEHPQAEAREALARGKQLSVWHRDAEAHDAFVEAARLDPTLFEARMRLARIALDAGRVDEARTLAAFVVRDVPHAPYPLELLGRAELALGHDAQALDALTKSRDVDPTRARLGFEIGRIDERLGRRDEALAAYRALVHADARALDARIALAHALMPGPPREEVRALLAAAKPLAAPGSPQATEIDGLVAWCDRLDAPPPPSLQQLAAVSAGLLAALRETGDVRVVFNGTLGDHAMDALGAQMGDPIGDNFGFGGLGVSGTGAGAGPVARLGTPTVRGSMAPEVVRRVVERHQNELRSCYEQELLSVPTLAGDATLHLVVAADGRVTTSSVSSTLGRDHVERCLASAARAWRFPADGGGIVLVDYPIHFAPQ